MRQLSDLKSGWALLGTREKIDFSYVFVLLVISSFASALMVGSIFPFLSILSDPENLEKNQYLKSLYDYMNFEKVTSFYFLIGYITLSLILISNVIQIINVWVMTKYVNNLAHNLSCRIFSMSLASKYDQFMAGSRDELSTLILSEVDISVKQFYKPVCDFLASILTVTSVVATLLYLQPDITMIALIFIFIFYFLIYILFTNRLFKIGILRLKMNEQRFSVLNDAFTNFKYIKFSGQEEKYVNTYNIASQKMTKTLVFLQVLSAIPQFLLQVVIFGGLITLCLYLMSQALSTNESVLGTIVPTLGLLGFAGQRLVPEINKLYQAISKFNMGSASIRKLSDVFTLIAIDDVQYDISSQKIKFQNNIKFDNVCYSYPGSASNTLNDCKFEIKAGEKVGIVGPSGSGKSTIVDLLLGLIKPTFGSVKVDEIDINENLKGWQKLLSYVPQNVLLGNGGFIASICETNDREIIDNVRLSKALKISQLSDFTQHGDIYSTQETNSNFSGGQIQRLGLARALFRQHEILLLDEPTSALDYQTENRLIDDVLKYEKDSTVIMIAHRLHSLKNFDKILFIKDGKVEGFASWFELIESCPDFIDFVNSK